MADMASRISRFKSLLQDFESTLQFFTSSPSRFHIVRTINPTSTSPKTLFILDSSFNPPSIAHLALATSAVKSPAASDSRPYKLLLLFSTHNADKAPSPAKFVERIAMMALFAEDLSRIFKDSVASSAQLGDANDPSNISIDIGLTKEPYYTDKSVAIAESQPNPYPSKPNHVHLVGYDTLIRFCNPKYYPKFTPPLSALTPFFSAGHKLRVTQRPHDPSDKSSSEYGTIEEQIAYLQSLKDGKLEQEGFEKAWGERIDLVEGDEAVGVSSTRIRNAAREGAWNEVEKLCTEGVAAWVKTQGLYEENTSGKKVMG